MTGDHQKELQEDLTEFPKLDVAASPASALQKEIASFAQLSSEAASTFPASASLQDALRFLLECPFVGTPRRVAANRSSVPPPPASSPTAPQEPLPSTVAELRALALRWRRKGSRSGEESEQVARLDHFLKDFQLQKRLYLFFLKRIYAPLYKHFFDLTIATGEAEEDEAQSFFLTECEEKKEEMKEEEGGGGGGTAEQLAALETRWRRVLEEEYSIKSAPLEKEEGERENGELNCILQLLPDLSAKCQLGVQLASQWLEDYQQRHPEEQEEGEGASGGGGATEELKTLRKALLKKEGEMRRGEHSVTILEAELETLKAREERVFALCSNCAQLEKHRESLSEKYATLVQERQTLTTEIENTIQGTQRLRDLSKRLKDLEMSVTNQYGELQMVEYALNLASDDYDLHMSLQPSFFAFSRTTADKLARCRTQQQSRKSQLAILQKRYDRARGLVDQMKHIEAVAGVGKADGDGEMALHRPGTNETYTKFRVPDRYSDAGQHSGSSSSDGGHDADEEFSEAPASPPPFPARPGPVRLLNHSTPLHRTAARQGAV